MDDLISASFGARRNEDIALDLLKFVAATAGVGRPAAPSTGFLGSSAPKPEEHVSQLLDLYDRCLQAVEGGKTEEVKAEVRAEAKSSQPTVNVAAAPAQAPQGWTPQS